ncbi:hypothetical protein C8Q80DRAFT_450391 [Daedaleopsis nitida]|nr:hypothetical protein C8Q80DRAFT_450391 [Daedaleopsis nitida]
MTNASSSLLTTVDAFTSRRRASALFVCQRSRFGTHERWRVEEVFWARSVRLHKQQRDNLPSNPGLSGGDFMACSGAKWYNGPRRLGHERRTPDTPGWSSDADAHGCMTWRASDLGHTYSHPPTSPSDATPPRRRASTPVAHILLNAHANPGNCLLTCPPGAILPPFRKRLRPLVSWQLCPYQRRLSAPSSLSEASRRFISPPT